MMLRPVRRIVTENDENGRSRIWMDAAATNLITSLTELWRTDEEPGRNERKVDMAASSTQLEPPRRGTLFRYFQLPPESQVAHLSDVERWEQGRQWFVDMNASHIQVDTTRHPSMHKSDSTDYIILLSGRITLVLDHDEVDLEPLDVVIQRGTNHAWANRGTEDALLMAVLVDESWQR